MKLPRLRLTFAAVTAAVLALSACAVPGQPGNPGVAGIMGDYEVTNQRLDQLTRAWADDTHGEVVPPSRRHLLTVELMRPQLLEAMAELGFDVDGEAAASQWLGYVQALAQQEGSPNADLITPGAPSADFVHSVEGFVALAVIAWTEPDHDVLTAIAEDVEANAVLSPRAGDFSTEAFLDQVMAAEVAVMNQQLEPVFYTEFVNVSGFVDDERDWLARD